MKKYKFCILWIILLMFVPYTYGAKPRIKIGYVDLQKLFYESKMGKDYEKKFKQRFKNEEKRLMEKDRYLKDKLKQYETQRNLMSKEALKATELELRRSFEKFQMEYTQARQKISKVDAKFTKDILKLIKKAVKEIGNREKFDYIFEKRNILFGGKDITDKVMKRINVLYKKKKK